VTLCSFLKRDPFKLGCTGNKHVSLLADSPGSQMSGALLFSRDAVKTPPVGGENFSGCGRLSGGARVEGGGEVRVEVGDGVEKRIDVGLEMM
jgi:hypothetical protein